MSIAELAVKHRVTVAMAILVVVLLGAVAYGRIPLDLLPNFDFPVIGVLTTATGAAPEEIEALLTRPLEEIVGTVPNIKSIQSTSSEGMSMIIAQFNWGTDMDFAALELRERIDLVRSAFPDDVTPPLVVKFDPSLLPVMTITLTGGANQVELRNLANDIVKQRLERVEGVASVAVIGGQEELIRVTVDPVKLAQHSISWSQLTLAMSTASLNLPGGRVSEDGKDYLIRSLGSVKSLQELADVVVGADLPAGIAGGLSGGSVSAGTGAGTGAGAAQLPNGVQLPAGFTLPAGMSLSEAWRMYQQWQAQSGNAGSGATAGGASGTAGSGSAASGDDANDPDDADFGDDSTIADPPWTGLPGTLPADLIPLLPGGGGRGVDDRPTEGSRGSGSATAGAADSADASATTLTVTPVHLGDVATIERVVGQATGYSRLDGADSVSLVIRKQSQANTVKVANMVGAAVAEAKRLLPANAQIVTTSNQANFIAVAIDMVKSSAWQGALLAVLILFIFLHSMASTIIIGLSIPISIIFAFALMYFTKLTLNIMTIGGLALGIGMLVDNSIVVLENIHRHVQEGEQPRDAAICGTREVAMAIAASTLTTVVVFLPVIFIGGVAGQLFRDLALTVTYSLLASLIVAMTFVPAAAVALSGWRPLKPTVGRDRLVDAYRRSLVWALARQRLVIGVALAALLLSIATLPAIGREFVPDMDQGELTVSLTMPSGTSIDRTDAVARQLEAEIRKLPELSYLAVMTGGGGSDALTSYSGSSAATGDTSTLTVRVVPLQQRNRGIDAIAADLRSRLATVAAAAGGAVSIGPSNGLFNAGGMMGSVEINLISNNLSDLRIAAASVADRLARVGGLANISTDFERGRPELRIAFDSDKLTGYGLVAAQVAQSVRSAFSGADIGTLLLDGRTLTVRAEYPSATRDQVADLSDLPLTTATGASIRLRDVATVDFGEGPASIRRTDGSRLTSVTADVTERQLSAVMSDIKAQLAAAGLPDGVTVTYGGEAEQMNEAFSGLSLAGWLAVVLVYAVMAAQFENLIHPFVILFTLPMALIGVLTSLYLAGMTISIPSVIGAITLAGVVVNNGIVMVDFINQRRRTGAERRIAVVEASSLRLRPILMTSLTTILGLAPMSFIRGEGSELTRPIGMVLMAGLATGTLLTLYVLPIIYLAVDRLTNRSGELRAAGE